MELLFIYFGTLLVLLALGLHVGSVLFLLGLIGALFFLSPATLLALGNLAWSTLNDFILVAIPLFILLGELLLRSGLADRMYSALAAWLSWLPGGLLHTNVGACALFAATSGSSVATAATIGTVALPTFKARGYAERLVVGSLAAGGTLGILIPPSINMIIYGAMTDTSIGQLFIAAIVPGLLLTSLFMLLILGISLLWKRAGEEGRTVVPLKERIRALKDLLPPLVIFAIVMGSIYFGFATPTEAAALGVVAALGFAALRGKLRIGLLHEAFKSTLRTTAMVMYIILAAFFLNFVISLIGLPQAVADWVNELGISPVATIWLLVGIYIVLGAFLETLSMMITTIPIVVPLVVSLGFDPVWFGIFLTILMELALITPPIGVNLYVVQGVRDPHTNINDVILGALPFVGMMLLMIVFLFFFPALATWLPSKLFVSLS